MVIINFSHPLSEQHIQQIQQLSGQDINAVHDIPCLLDHGESFIEQIRRLADSVPVPPDVWQTSPLLVNLPSLHTAAALMLAELHGRMGHFPTVIRMRPVAGATPTRFEVAELINLETVRQSARTCRFC